MIDAIDSLLIASLQNGLPIVSRPYQYIGHQLGLEESEVIERLFKLKQQGIIKRHGVIVNHRKLGYLYNAMVVFDIPDALIQEIGQKMGQMRFVNLCYQRPRQGSVWPYNLYCMIHGKNRETVLAQLDQLIANCGIESFNYEVLFSKQCFKQKGASYYFNEQSQASYG